MVQAARRVPSLLVIKEGLAEERVHKLAGLLKLPDKASLWRYPGYWGRRGAAGGCFAWLPAPGMSALHPRLKALILPATWWNPLCAAGGRDPRVPHPPAAAAALRPGGTQHEGPGCAAGAHRRASSGGVRAPAQPAAAAAERELEASLAARCLPAHCSSPPPAGHEAATHTFTIASPWPDTCRPAPARPPTPQVAQQRLSHLGEVLALPSRERLLQLVADRPALLTVSVEEVKGALSKPPAAPPPPQQSR